MAGKKIKIKIKKIQFASIRANGRHQVAKLQK